MEPNDWPADMRNHNLSEAARDAYWHFKDCERAAEKPICDMITAIALNGVAFFIVGWWALLSLPVLTFLCIRFHRRSVSLWRHAVQAKTRLDVLKAQGAKVCL